MRELGTPMPNFELPDTVTGQLLRSRDWAGQIVVVAFICNHCPFVIHLKRDLAAFGRYCQTLNVTMSAISSNDAVTYPADAPELMKADAAEFDYVFPYLYDESQSVARAFDAACTPDFFVFDRQGALAYRGQFDDSRPGNGVPVTGQDLKNAVAALVAGERPSPVQKPSIGCNIKWKG